MGRIVLRKSISSWVMRMVERLFLRRMFFQTYLVMGGHIYFQTLSAAVQFDLFTLLARKGRLSRSQIASDLGLEEKPARIVLLGCTSLGLLKKHRDGTYSNTFLSRRLLNGERRDNILPIIKWQHFINYRAMFHFAEALKSNANVGLREITGQGQTLYERLSSHPDLERIFQDAMQSISVQANHLLAEAVDLSNVARLLDVGGGNATNIINLARAYPHLRADVFDWPSVCGIAQANIRNAGLSERLGTVCGNCFSDPFPPGIDCILFAHFMTIWSEDRNKELLTKAYHSLPAGGACIIFNMMQENDEKGPLSSALGSPYFLALATGEGMLYTWNEYETWMKSAGFSRVLKRKLIRDHGLIIGIK